MTLLAVMLPPVLCGALITSFHSSGEAWVLAASTLITLGLLCKTALADPGIVALCASVPLPLSYSYGIAELCMYA